MIRLENVNKYFNKHKKNQIHVINNMSIKFPNQGLIALLGPSGCGKTTLLNTIGGLDKVSSGHIYVDGKRITKRSSHKVDEIRNLNIGYIFQDYKLVDTMTVFENVALSLKIVGIKDKEEVKKRVLYTLEKVNMLRYKNRPVSMLSGGERQRVGIARALVKNPKIIIADEPTGNLDSKNSLEIMNIIKSISSKYLVILVTHEVELAKFYASRIIELQDGNIIKDYENDYAGSLNYKIENQIYLKDFENIKNIQKDNINIDIYRDNNEDLDITVVFKNGNIYVETKNKEKIEVIDNNSNIELINDHYKELENPEIKEDTFDIESISDSKYREKYSSIFKLASFISYGFKKVFTYPVLKKILLGGFFLSGMFIFYAIATIFGTINIEDKDFISMNKNYLIANVSKMNLDDYLSYEKLDNISYILPGNSIISFRLYFDKYLQTSSSFGDFKSSLTSINNISKDDIILGRMPNNKNELVFDVFQIKYFIKMQNSKSAGFSKIDDFLNHKVYLNNMEFTIVGFTDQDEPNVYAYDSEFINMIANSYADAKDYDMASTDVDVNKILDYNLVKDKIKLIEGTLPQNDYEVIVNKENKDTYPLNKNMDLKVNGKKLKVVGYYESILGSDILNYLVNSNTIKYDLVTKTSNITLLSSNKDETIKYFKDKKINIVDSYEHDKSEYLKSNKDRMINALVLSGVILIISLIEILLMIRSSFLSRIKEVGIFRAIGVKKSDIYKMFTGEIIAITIIASIPGILFMTYILYCLSRISYISSLFMVNVFTVGISILLILVFNVIVGLLPVLNTIRKTPAQILSRVDVD